MTARLQWLFIVAATVGVIVYAVARQAGDPRTSSNLFSARTEP